ncbi:MAG TPA: hypothetical protein VLC55_05495 [Burkholderiales bacterium]|nr:hypothetical protein [Burkholderiales bacterium]
MALSFVNPPKFSGGRVEIKVSRKEEQDDLATAINNGTILVDGARRRPFYFDGRFLTADDLTADQDYARARQSDLAQAIGPGVISGLMVNLERGATANNVELLIEEGLGITPAGDLVVVGEAVRTRLDAIPESATIDAQLGIKQLATAAARNRSGLYLLALRPVEFSTNPVPSYPTSLDGARSVHDGDIVEATAVTLIPYPDRSGSEDVAAKRARVAREIFFEGQRPGVLQEALPLAMLCLEGGALRWLDVYLVRREVGAESTLAAGLSQRPRALLEAWFKQHQDHVAAIGAPAIAGGFNATKYFDALPPVGMIPASTLKFDGQTLTQSFFPPVVDCEFAFVPSDEVAVLVDEALALPPIDLLSGDEDLDQLSVLIVAPVTRQELEAHKRNLANVARTVRAAAPLALAKRSPLEALTRITVSPRLLLPVGAQEQQVANAWSGALQAAQNAALRANRGCFWYLRRRQLPYYAEISGATVRLAGDAAALDTEVEVRLAKDKLFDRFQEITKTLPRLAQAEAVNLLAAPRLALSEKLSATRVATSDLLRRAAFTALDQGVTKPATGVTAHQAVLDVARRFGDPRLGEGFEGLRAAASDADQQTLAQDKAVAAIAASGVAPELDAAARVLAPAAQAAFANKLAAAATAGRVDDIKALVRKP